MAGVLSGEKDDCKTIYKAQTDYISVIKVGHYYNYLTELMYFKFHDSFSGRKGKPSIDVYSPDWGPYWGPIIPTIRSEFPRNEGGIIGWR